MSVADLETIVRKSSSDIESVFARLYLGICLGADGNAGCQNEKRNKNWQPVFHFGSSLLCISVMALPTDSLIFFTSSKVGALPGGKETSFSISPSCSLTSFTRGSPRNSGEISLIFDCMKRTSAGCRETFAR